MASINQLSYPSNIKPLLPKLVIVYGAPASGKSTYVKNNAGANDLVLDLDDIIQSMSGLPAYTDRFKFMGKALTFRNETLVGLSRANPKNYDTVWLILTCRKREHIRYMLRKLKPTRTVAIATPKQICLDRINSDPARSAEKEFMLTAVEEWWKNFRPSEDEEVIL